MTLWLVICEAAMQVTATSASNAESYAREDAGDFMADNEYSIADSFEVPTNEYATDDEIRIEANVSPADGEEEPDDDDDDPDDITWDAVASLTVIVEAATREEAHDAALARLALGGD